MEIKNSHIPDLLIIKPKVFYDNRGYFYETYQTEVFKKCGIDLPFVQDNQSLSQKGTLRGLHFQAPPHEQGKLVRVIKGAVLDVAVDIRKGSPTYGQHQTVELTEENHLMFWIPPGFAHGFLTLVDDTIFSYKCTGYYNKASEGGIAWDDKSIGIDWGMADVLLSEKDLVNDTLENFASPFTYIK
jgi:dTDP-4-dehydrorhamnose 3,5-epimerase